MFMNFSLLPDADKINLTADDLFDRIINIKLVCKNVKTGKADEFVIRSDYELVYPNMSLDNSLNNKGFNYIIRKCTYKPSIKVQYTRVTANTGIEIKVFISNFFIFSKDGNHLMSFTADDYKVISVEIAMGYWGQFKQPTVPTLDEFFTIKAENGADKLVMGEPGSIVVTTEKLPPDSTMCIKGFVSSVLSSPVGITKATEFSAVKGNAVIKSSDKLEDVLFNQITRRYLNPRSINKSGSYNIIDTSNIENTDLSKAGIKLEANTNLMSKTDAEKYGIKVFLSEKAKKLTLPKMKDSEGNEQDKIIYFEPGWTIGQTMTRFINSTSLPLEYCFTNNSDMLVYCEDEITDIVTLCKNFTEEGIYEETVLEKNYKNNLPAVYNINVDALATITCPFFTFFEPFQKFNFASRYALTSLVSYVASYKPTINQFIAIKVSISFATVENINEMTIIAVSVKEAGNVI